MNKVSLITKIRIKTPFYFKIFMSKFLFLIFYTPVGSRWWFVKKEIYFGGYKTNIKRKLVSDYDLRSQNEINYRGMTGGDRMLIHGYAKDYSNYLKKFTKNNLEKFNILEVGILQGTGLAVWASTFPNSNIFGADIDLSHFESNKKNLNQKLDLNFSNIKVFQFDQLNPEKFNFLDIDHKSLDIVIDDGLHSTESILKTARFLNPYLSEKFVYFIEDVVVDIKEDLEKLFPDCKIIKSKQLFIIKNN